MTTTNITTLQQAAAHFYGFFEKRNRNTGDTYWCVRDNAPEYVKELCFEAHGDMMPDDFRYAFIVEALSALSDTDEPDDINIEADPYTHDLLRWLGSNLQRAEYCNAAAEDFGLETRDIIEWIRLGQLREKREVLGCIESFLETWLDEQVGTDDE
jgi:hypothetical protein